MFKVQPNWSFTNRFLDFFSFFSLPIIFFEYYEVVK